MNVLSLRVKVLVLSSLVGATLIVSIRPTSGQQLPLCDLAPITQSPPAIPALVPVPSYLPARFALQGSSVVPEPLFGAIEVAAFASGGLKTFAQISLIETCFTGPIVGAKQVVGDLQPGLLTSREEKRHRVVRFEYLKPNASGARTSRIVIEVGGPAAGTADVVALARLVNSNGIAKLLPPKGMTLRHRSLHSGQAWELKQNYDFSRDGTDDPSSGSISIGTDSEIGGPLNSFSERRLPLDKIGNKSGKKLSYEQRLSTDNYSVRVVQDSTVVIVSGRSIKIEELRKVAASLVMTNGEEAAVRYGNAAVAVASVPPPYVTTTSLFTPPTPPVTISMPSGIPVTQAVPLTDESAGPMLFSGTRKGLPWFVRARIMPNSLDMCTLFRENNVTGFSSGDQTCLVRGSSPRSGIVAVTAHAAKAGIYIEIATGPEVHRIVLAGSNGEQEILTVSHPQSTGDTVRLAVAEIDVERKTLSAFDKNGKLVKELTGSIKPDTLDGWGFR